MTEYPTAADLLEMSMHSFAEHSRDLLSKYGQMTPDQRKEFREIAMSILTDEKELAA